MLLTKPADRETTGATLGITASGLPGRYHPTQRVARIDHDPARTGSSERESAQSGVKVFPSLEGATCLALHVGIPLAQSLRITLAAHTGWVRHPAAQGHRLSTWTWTTERLAWHYGFLRLPDAGTAGPTVGFYSLTGESARTGFSRTRPKSGPLSHTCALRKCST